MENNMTIKRSYVDPKDAPPGVPCRFCDMPAGAQGLGRVLSDGVAVDGKRPLFSHAYCLMNSGGLKQDNHDFSLQDLNLNNRTSSKKENIWEFASKMRYVAHTDMDNVTETAKKPKVKPMTNANAEEEYSDPNTGASQPPSK
jgi:hypothetical protein